MLKRCFLLFTHLLFMLAISGCSIFSIQISDNATKRNLTLRSVEKNESLKYDIKYYQDFSLHGMHIFHLYKNGDFFKELYLPRNLYAVKKTIISNDGKYILLQLKEIYGLRSTFGIWDIANNTFLDVNNLEEIGLLVLSTNNTIVFQNEKTKEIKFFNIPGQKFIKEFEDPTTVIAKNDILEKGLLANKHKEKYLHHGMLTLDSSSQNIYINHSNKSMRYGVAKKYCTEGIRFALDSWDIADISDYRNFSYYDFDEPIWATEGFRVRKNRALQAGTDIEEPMGFSHTGFAGFMCKRQLNNKQFDTIYSELERLNDCMKISTTAHRSACYDNAISKSLYLKDYTTEQKKDFLEYVAYDIAQQKNTIESYESYMKKYPSGRDFKSALDAKNKLIEFNDYSKAVKLNKLNVYNNFLSKYPNSSYASDIKTKKDDVDPVVIAKRKQEAKEAARRAEEERKRQIEYENRPIDYVTVNIERICGWLCSFKNLNISGGPGRFSKTYDSAYSGAIHKGYNGQIAGTYTWSAKASDDSEYCSGTVYISGKKRNVTINVYKGCRDPYINEF